MKGIKIALLVQELQKACSHFFHVLEVVGRGSVISFLCSNTLFHIQSMFIQYKPYLARLFLSSLREEGGEGGLEGEGAGDPAELVPSPPSPWSSCLENWEER